MNTLKGNYCTYLRKSRADLDSEIRGEEETLKRHRRILEEYFEFGLFVP